MKMTWSCVVEGEPVELSAFITQIPALLALSKGYEFSGTTQDSTEPAQPESEIISEEPVAEIPSAEEPAQQDEVADDTARRSARYQRPIKDQIVTFLEGRSTANLRQIAKATGIPSTKLSPRIAELKNDGIIARATNKKAHNRYRLLRPRTEETPSKVVDVETFRERNSEYEDFLAILNALVDNPGSTARGLRGATQISEDIVEERCRALAERKLIAAYQNGEKTQYIALPPTRATQLRRDDSTPLRDVVLETVRIWPNSTSAQIAIRLGMSYTDVARRLSDLARAGEVTQGGVEHDKAKRTFEIAQRNLEYA